MKQNSTLLCILIYTKKESRKHRYLVSALNHFYVLKVAVRLDKKKRKKKRKKGGKKEKKEEERGKNPTDTEIKSKIGFEFRRRSEPRAKLEEKGPCTLSPGILREKFA